ncbi:MAG: hypothetical protein ACOYL6_01765 [Bacteriovoracaceae bacterium]
MISYPVYKLLHLFSVIFFVALLSLQIFLNEKHKKIAIFSGILSLFVLIGGMGLLARLGISHRGGWPLWAIIKLLIWIALGIAFPILIKRTPKLKSLLWYPLVILVLLAVYSAVFKPGM